MKKACSILVIIILLFTCSCASEYTTNKSVIFYYPRLEFLYGVSDTVMGSEIKSSDLRGKTLEEIINAYLVGPTDSHLSSPLSDGIQLLDCRTDVVGLHITFSAELADLSPTNLTVGLCALSKTLFQITDIESICIHANETLLDGEQKIVYTRDNIYLLDSFTDRIPNTTNMKLNGDSQ